MSAQQRTRPTTVLALLIGASLAVALAYWSISRALNPSPPYSTAATAGATVAAPGQMPPRTGAPEGSARVAVRPAATGEASLALTADPFIPLPEMPPPGLRPASPILPVFAGGRRLPTLPSPGTWPSSGGALPPLEPIPPPGSRSLPMPQEDAIPVLAGTLLGERASAVFNTDAGLVAIPVGKKLGSWKVLSVNHGSALVKSGGRTARLLVGGSRAPGIGQAKAGEQTSPEIAEDEPPSDTVVVTEQPVSLQETAESAMALASAAPAVATPPDAPSEPAPLSEMDPIARPPDAEMPSPPEEEAKPEESVPSPAPDAG